MKVRKRELESLSQRCGTRLEPEVVRWEPPQGNKIKVNFDASLQRDSPRSITGIVIQNRDGLTVGACAYPLWKVLDPLVAEA